MVFRVVLQLPVILQQSINFKMEYSRGSEKRNKGKNKKREKKKHPYKQGGKRRGQKF